MDERRMHNPANVFFANLTQEIDRVLHEQCAPVPNFVVLFWPPGEPFEEDHMAICRPENAEQEISLALSTAKTIVDRLVRKN